MIVATRKKVFDKICPLCDHEFDKHIVSFTTVNPNTLRVRCIELLHHKLKCKCNAGFESKVTIEAEIAVQTIEETARRLRPKRYRSPNK